MNGMNANYLFLCGVSAAAVLGGGCTHATGMAEAGRSPTVAQGSMESADATPPRVIAKGMEGEEIVRRIGKPSEIRPVDTPDGRAEIWVYRRNAGQDTTLSATTVSQRLVIHPLTGAHFTVPEPSYSTERRELLETTNLLLYEGKLAEWTRTVEAKRSYN